MDRERAWYVILEGLIELRGMEPVWTRGFSRHPSEFARGSFGLMTHPADHAQQRRRGDVSTTVSGGRQSRHPDTCTVRVVINIFIPLREYPSNVKVLAKTKNLLM